MVEQIIRSEGMMIWQGAISDTHFTHTPGVERDPIKFAKYPVNDFDNFGGEMWI